MVEGKGKGRRCSIDSVSVSLSISQLVARSFSERNFSGETSSSKAVTSKRQEKPAAARLASCTLASPTVHHLHEPSSPAMAITEPRQVKTLEEVEPRGAKNELMLLTGQSSVVGHDIGKLRRE